jgi:hypothetical protein
MAKSNIFIIPVMVGISASSTSFGNCEAWLAIIVNAEHFGCKGSEAVGRLATFRVANLATLRSGAVFPDSSMCRLWMHPLIRVFANGTEVGPLAIDQIFAVSGTFAAGKLMFRNSSNLTHIGHAKQLGKC